MYHQFCIHMKLVSWQGPWRSGEIIPDVVAIPYASNDVTLTACEMIVRDIDHFSSSQSCLRFSLGQ